MTKVLMYQIPAIIVGSMITQGIFHNWTMTIIGFVAAVVVMAVINWLVRSK